MNGISEWLWRDGMLLSHESTSVYKQTTALFLPFSEVVDSVTVNSFVPGSSSRSSHGYYY